MADGVVQIAETISTHYGDVELERIDIETTRCTILTSSPLVDRQTKLFGASTTVMNEIAVARRLGLAFVRDQYKLSHDVAITVKSVRTGPVVINSERQNKYIISLEVIEKKGQRLDAVKATINQQFGSLACETQFEFGILTPSVDRFIRLSRNFSDFAEVEIERQFGLVTDNGFDQFTYSPAEIDRLVDGKRVDHIPAIRLIDIILSSLVNLHASNFTRVTMEFYRYIDPRRVFEFHIDPLEYQVAIIQDESLVAVMNLKDGVN